MNQAIGVLEIAAEAAEANAPINDRLGNHVQAEFERETATQCRAAITILRQQPAQSVESAPR